ncbi:MAG TPA: hypothetical protein VEZ17_14705 [Chitinophagaceae bacterium]|jgi:hypothetical protein|nr:hypothetical protein [Chitinophagaceae bacterium]
MPNEANKSKSKTGIVQKKRKPTMPVTDKQKTEGQAAKDSNASNAQKSATASSARKGSKKASGDSGNDG